MFGLKTLSRHADLVQRMTDTLGRDPAADMIASPGGASAFRAAILGCTTCGDPKGCARWLDARDRADAPPDWCRGAGYFARLDPRPAVT